MKVFRDPIHNVIDLDTGDKNVNNLILKLIDSQEFQRLRYIKQLGFVYFAYPSANHTRFEHSIGVAFLAKRFVEKIISTEERVLSIYSGKDYDLLKNFYNQINEDRHITIIAALLHDIGHGPFSHVFERITGISHEDWTREIILGNTNINRLLKEFNPSYPQKICSLLTSPDTTTPSAQIIAGQMDVDKMDYLLRDSHMTGSGYGKYDIEWLFNVLTVGVVNNHAEIGLDEGKGASVAEDFVMARIYMFRNVYLHKTSQITQEMLYLLIKRINENKNININENLKKILFANNKKQPNVLLNSYLSISDIDMLYLLKTLQNSNDDILKNISSGILNRHLFKNVDEKTWNKAYDTINNKEYYLTKIELGERKEKLVCHPDKENINLFNKNGECFSLFEKSSILPTEIKESIYPTEYYIDRDIYKQGGITN